MVIEATGWFEDPIQNIIPRSDQHGSRLFDIKVAAGQCEKPQWKWRIGHSALGNHRRYSIPKN